MNLLRAVLQVPLLLAFSCAGELEGAEESYVASLGADGGSACGDVSGIFFRNCTASVCHDGDAPAGQLDLASSSAPARLVEAISTDPACGERKLIDPSNPGASFLLEKLESSSPECGDPMPLGGTLADEDIACIRAWIFGLASPPFDGGPTEGGTP